MDYIIIILKSIFVYVYLICLLRFLGKKEFSQLSIFDFVVFLIIAEMMTMSFDEEWIEMIDSIIATFSLVLIDKCCSRLAMQSKKIRDLLEGKPTYIIYQGKIDQKAMKKLNYNVDSLCQQLRSQQIGSVSEIQYAILETNGDLSILTKKDSKVVHPEPLILDGQINQDVLKQLNYSPGKLKQELKSQHVEIEDVFYCVLEKQGLFFIKK